MALGQVMQNGFVVKDLDAALRYWTVSLGIGPFYRFDPVVLRTSSFRGIATEVRLAAAIAYSGDLQIELIQPLGDGPSPYADFLGAGREGLHHVAFVCDDVAAEAARLREDGHTELLAFESPSGFGVYLEPPIANGTCVECLAFAPPMKAFLDRLKEASRGWKGDRPVRTVRS
jgi:methylmalonyl-CoA/ethylmalonyl-CoA epimerase